MGLFKKHGIWLRFLGVRHKFPWNHPFSFGIGYVFHQQTPFSFLTALKNEQDIFDCLALLIQVLTVPRRSQSTVAYSWLLSHDIAPTSTLQSKVKGKGSWAMNESLPLEAEVILLVDGRVKSDCLAVSLAPSKSFNASLFTEESEEVTSKFKSFRVCYCWVSYKMLRLALQCWGNLPWFCFIWAKWRSSLQNYVFCLFT